MMEKGTIIKDYKILEKIGQGGMATVYKAVHTSLNKEVAIKCLNSEFYGNENIRKRFVAEARTLFTLSHPNLTRVTDLIKTDDILAIVMEYIDGRSLKKYILEKGALDAVEIKQIFSTIVDGVSYIHRKGFIHRDIKPSNFMIDNNGDVKILDFGIAKNLDTSSAEYTMTGTSQMMGTPMYMSPEQIKSTKDITIQTDIYSLGVVLWNMVTGTKPYDQHTLSIPEIQVSILKEDLKLTNTVFDKIIQKATKKDTSVRLQKCEEFNINNISLEKDVVDDDKTVVDVVDDDKTIIDVVDDEKTVVDIVKDEKTIVDIFNEDWEDEKIQGKSQQFGSSRLQKLPNATTTLVLGICSLILFLIPFVTWPCAIIALSISKKSKQLLNENPNGYSDAGTHKAGRICAFVGLILSIIWVLILAEEL